MDIDAHYDAGSWSSYVSYSFLDATYQFAGTLASPNNPSADANGDVAVTPGRHIPINPAHSFRAGGEMKLTPKIRLGGEFVFTGSEYFDGDEANQNQKLPSRWTANVRGSWRFASGLELFGVVNNVFNRHDATYGTYFQPDNTAGLLTLGLGDPRSITLQQPISVQIGVTVTF